jgi:hypothetical protein
MLESYSPAAGWRGMERGSCGVRMVFSGSKMVRRRKEGVGDGGIM